MPTKTSRYTVLITGATSGIGAFLARHLDAKGCRLILHARNRSKLKGLIHALTQRDHLTLVADYLAPKTVDSEFRKLSQSGITIDVLINNAFGKLECPLVEAHSDALNDFFAVSVAGTANVIRNALPLMKPSRLRNIINIVADWGFPMHNIMTGPAPYIAAKYAIHGLGAALQTELAAFQIRTTTLCPGIVEADAAYAPEKEPAVNKKAIHPIDIANAIDFIISQNYSHIRSIVLSPRNPQYNGL